MVGNLYYLTVSRFANDIIIGEAESTEYWGCSNEALGYSNQAWRAQFTYA